MDREDMEKEFLNNLERILTGEEIELSPAMTEDCRTALDFAREMIRLRVAPSPVFQERLKDKLLHKLDKQKTAAPAEKQGSFWERLGETWRKPVWRTVTVTLLVALVTVGIMGRVGVFTRFVPPPTEIPPPIIEIPPPVLEPTPSPAPPPTPAPAPAPRPQAPIEVMAATERESYLPGEEIVIEFSFKNTTDEPHEIAPFPPEIEILGKGPHDEVVRSFLAGNLFKLLESGEVVKYELTWDQLDSLGQRVDYGYYQLMIPEFPPRLNGFYILPAEGVINKRVKIDESQTVNGVTCIWEQVMLRPGGLSFQAVIVPPGYDYETITRHDPESPPELPPLPVAEYQVDDNPAIDAGLPSIIDPIKGGIRYVWHTPVPVANGSKELSFTVTRFGELEGPWEFSIPLEP